MLSVNVAPAPVVSVTDTAELSVVPFNVKLLPAAIVDAKVPETDPLSVIETKLVSVTVNNAKTPVVPLFEFVTFKIGELVEIFLMLKLCEPVYEMFDKIVSVIDPVKPSV